MLTDIYGSILRTEWTVTMRGKITSSGRRTALQCLVSAARKVFLGMHVFHCFSQLIFHLQCFRIVTMATASKTQIQQSYTIGAEVDTTNNPTAQQLLELCRDFLSRVENLYVCRNRHNSFTKLPSEPQARTSKCPWTPIMGLGTLSMMISAF